MNVCCDMIRDTGLIGGEWHDLECCRDIEPGWTICRRCLDEMRASGDFYEYELRSMFAVKGDGK